MILLAFTIPVELGYIKRECWSVGFSDSHAVTSGKLVFLADLAWLWKLCKTSKVVGSYASRCRNSVVSINSILSIAMQSQHRKYHGMERSAEAAQDRRGRQDRCEAY